MYSTTLADLPDVPLRMILKYLPDLDIYHLGQIGNTRLYQITRDFVDLGNDVLYSIINVENCFLGLTNN